MHGAFWEGGFGVRSVSDLAAAAGLHGDAAFAAALVLTGTGQAHPVQQTSAVEQATPACDRLNSELQRLAKAGRRLSALASPVLGAGVPVSRLQQVFLMSYAQGARQADQWARFAWQASEPTGKALLRKIQLLPKALAFHQSLKIYAGLSVTI
jgi:hypothetical protein